MKTVIEYETIFEEKNKGNKAGNPKIQKIKHPNGSSSLHVWIPLIEVNKRMSCVGYRPTYEGIKAMIRVLIDLYGKSKVEKELGIKIREVKREHGGR